jgi:hypothetical protein
MHYVLYVLLRGFYVSAIQPQASDAALIVHRARRVLDCCELAAAQGVRIGSTLAEAKGICRGGRYLEWSEEPFREAQERWLDLCSAFSDVIEPEEQHSAWIDLQAHPDPQATAQQLLDQLIKSGFNARGALAAARWQAKAFVLAQDPSAAGLLPSLDPLDLPTRLLLPISEEHRQRLLFLGYRTLRDVSRLPLSVLREQFQHEGLRIRLAVRGGLHTPVAAAYPPGSLAERVSLDSPAAEVEPLENCLKELAQRLGDHLERRAEQSHYAALCIDFEEGESISLQRKFSKPLANRLSALSSLKLLVHDALPQISGRLEERGDRVVCLRAQALHLEPVRSRQETLGLRQVEREPNPNAHDPTRVLDAVQSKFGDNAVRVASQLPEPRRKAVLRAWREATGWS